MQKLFAVLVVGAGMIGCGGPGYFREQSASFIAETGSARYYNAHGTWSGHPHTPTVTLKRVDKWLGLASYGDQAAASLDREAPGVAQAR